MKYSISGIQQVGVGVTDVKEAWAWYREYLGMDIRIFEDASIAGLMLPYTGNEPRERYAVLAFNLQGGGGFEIWQHTGRKPVYADEPHQLGDTGILITKVKSYDLEAAHCYLVRKGIGTLSGIQKDPSGRKFFFLKDPWGNIFQLCESEDFFHTRRPISNGGVSGVVIGVSDIEKSFRVYRDLLGYDQTVYDINGHFADLEYIEGSEGRFRRVLLRHSKPRKGAFSPLLGNTEIELVQSLDREPRQIYRDRMWGDPGFIHLCFDINGMDDLRETCKSHGFPFTVDSAKSFDMGEAAGHFSYIEDADGTLIEFVEAHRIPIVKKLGWYLNLRKRNPEKPLPGWMLRAMRFNRVK